MGRHRIALSALDQARADADTLVHVAIEDGEGRPPRHVAAAVYVPILVAIDCADFSVADLAHRLLGKVIAHAIGVVDRLCDAAHGCAAGIVRVVTVTAFIFEHLLQAEVIVLFHGAKS
mgnify:CR=1 FL=1